VARPPSDDPLDRLLTRALSSRASAGDVCPEPDLLAAFVDGSLERAERDLVERHAASCSRCAHILAATLASAPATELPSHRAVWAGWRAWRWAIPAATAVTVAGVWFASSRPRDLAVPTAVEEKSAAPAEPAAIAQVPASPTAASKPEAKSTEVAREAYRSEALAKKERDISEREVAPPPAAAPLEARADSQERQVAAESKQALADAAPSAKALAAQQPASPPTARNFEQAAPQAAAGAVAAPRSRAEAIALTVPTPDPAVQWRIRGVIIERSTDRGTTWAVEYTASQPIAGGSAPSVDVAWFFSGNSLVLRRTPARWVQITAPAGVQVLSIEATSATQATIRVAGGRTFETRDGGATWTQR
jgi:hypothetical protein